jgi:hypothetical protein
VRARRRRVGVVIADVSCDAGEAVAADIRAGGGQADFARTDVSDRSPPVRWPIMRPRLGMQTEKLVGEHAKGQAAGG